MYQRLSAVMFPILILLLIGAGFWGYQENQEKNTILIKAENQYQRAFHNLSYHMDELHSELGNALAVNSASQNFHRKCLVNVWRITSEAQSEIGQLPLTLTPFHETEKFLAQIAKFSYNVALRDMKKEPLTPDEMKALRELHQRSKEIAADVRKVQAKVLENNLRWMDVEIASASMDEPMDNMIIDGFKLVNQRVTEYSEVNFGPSQPGLFQTKGYEKLSGSMMTPQEIQQKAMDFFQIDGKQDIQITENAKGTQYNSYSVTIRNGDENRTIKADYTKRGGHLLWFNNNRPVEAKRLTVDQAREQAQQFLSQHGFKEMSAISYDEYNNVASLTMASKIGDVVIFPEKLTIKVALDNGEVTGLQAGEYVQEHKDRVISKPKLSAEDARNKLNPEFKVAQQTLGIMENTEREEILVYEFIGNIMGSDYRIYINADTGMEEQVEQIRQQDLAVGTE